MPDWTYQTILRPVLFRLPPETARAVTLGITGLLGALPGGKLLIDTLGHMRPPDGIQRQVAGLSVPGPVGLSAGLDRSGQALAALQHFGFGFLEIGPVTLEPIRANRPIRLDRSQEAVCYPDVPVNDGVQALVHKLQAAGPLSIPLGIRLSVQPGIGVAAATAERCQLIEKLAPLARFLTVDYLEHPAWSPDDWQQHLAALCWALRGAMANRDMQIKTKPGLWLCLPPDLDTAKVNPIVALARAQDSGGLLAGLVVADGVRTGDGAPGYRLVGASVRDQALRLVRSIRETGGDRLPIMAGAGIHDPADALAFIEAGASLVQIHSGFIYSGPGLPKRINEAVAFYCSSHPPLTGEPRRTLFKLPAWVWMLLLGLGLIISSIIIGIVAFTRTVLPYDEAFVGLSRADLIAINSRLLPFMAHDRVTVAGTMISTGFLYVGLAFGGLRRGLDWARRILLLSGLAGFLSFFLFLGFGYFDPVHGILTAGLFPLFVAVMCCKLPPVSATPPNLTNNRRWRIGQWGQLLMVTVGFGLLAAGMTISLIGITQVFVPQDLHFMNTTAEALRTANPYLVPLIAHDRAGFGGDLISVGIGVVLLALWGFRQGARWVWWTLALSSVPGFVAAVGIHLVVGYLDIGHLFPAVAALVLFLIGLGLSFPYLYWPERRTDGHINGR